MKALLPSACARARLGRRRQHATRLAGFRCRKESAAPRPGACASALRVHHKTRGRSGGRSEEKA